MFAESRIIRSYIQELYKIMLAESRTTYHPMSLTGSDTKLHCAVNKQFTEQFVEGQKVSQNNHPQSRKC